MIVCLNKQDDPHVNYSEERYNEIKKEATGFLKKTGYKTDNIPFVPISGWTGENLREKNNKDTGKDNMPWYKGPTLIGALDSMQPPERPLDKPLRLPINDVFKISGIGTVPVGRVETGVLKPGMQLRFAPSNLTAECKSVEMHHTQLTQAIPGDNVGLSVRNIPAKDLKKGYVISNDKDDPAKEVESFVAKVIVLNHPNQINAGYTPIVDCHTSHVACKFDTLVAKVDRRTGKTMEENPPLGRFAIRDMKQTVAVGIIQEVTKKEGRGK